jgi:hypothetical protein
MQRQGVLTTALASACTNYDADCEITRRSCERPSAASLLRAASGSFGSALESTEGDDSSRRCAQDDSYSRSGWRQEWGNQQMLDCTESTNNGAPCNGLCPDSPRRPLRPSESSSGVLLPDCPLQNRKPRINGSPVSGTKKKGPHINVRSFTDGGWMTLTFDWINRCAHVTECKASRCATSAFL